MTEPRDWPNNARAARDRAAELMVEAGQNLEPIVKEQPLTYEASYRRVAKALACTQQALRWLEATGAQTRPVE